MTDLQKLLTSLGFIEGRLEYFHRLASESVELATDENDAAQRAALTAALEELTHAVSVSVEAATAIHRHGAAPGGTGPMPDSDFREAVAGLLEPGPQGESVH